jgi:SCP-2 sterol transfer family
MSTESPVPAALAEMSRGEVEAYLAGISGILGGDDDAITAAVAGLEGGTARLLRFLAAGMVLSFCPERAEGQTGLVEIHIVTPEGEIPLWLEIDLDECRTSATGSDSDTTVTVPLAVFVRIAFKRISGADAYMDGMVRAAGDVVLATTLDEWFDPPDLAAAAAFERFGLS